MLENTKWGEPIVDLADFFTGSKKNYRSSEKIFSTKRKTFVKPTKKFLA